jgi:hypothetical protein
MRKPFPIHLDMVFEWISFETQGIDDAPIDHDSPLDHHSFCFSSRGDASLG